LSIPDHTHLFLFVNSFSHSHSIFMNHSLHINLGFLLGFLMGAYCWAEYKGCLCHMCLMRLWAAQRGKTHLIF
jgi:hypothetical protein